MKDKYCASFYAGKEVTIVKLIWRWWEMMPTVCTNKHTQWTRYAMSLTEQEGDFMLADQSYLSPRWTIFFKALSGLSMPMSILDRSIKNIQVEDITGASREHGYHNNQYVATNSPLAPIWETGPIPGFHIIEPTEGELVDNNNFVKGWTKV